MFKFLALPTVAQVQQETQRLASAAAQHCYAQAIGLTGPRLASFNFNGARGYVRAKVGGLLRGELARLRVTLDHDLPDLSEPALDQALESLTQLLLGELLKQQRIGGLRLAA